MSVPLRHGRDPALDAQVREVLAGLERRPAPLGSFRRLMSLGGLQASLLGHYARARLREVFRDAEEAERRRAEAHFQAALLVLSRMGYLRGLVLKLGQVLASMPTVVPAEWADVLGHLQWEAPAMHYPLVRDQLRAELGGDPEEVFASFERRAFAAASLGQVHRARLESGEEVAVKVQYPGIGRTIQVDLRNLRALLQPLRLFVHWDDLMAIFEDFAAALEREADYRSEAAFQERAAAALADAPGIHVPRVHREFSSERVLVTEHRAGFHLDALLAEGPSDDLLARYGERIAEAQHRLNLGARLIYTDANAGNVLFHDSGDITLLDFGSMRELEGAEWDFFRRSCEARSRFDPREVERLALEAATVPVEELPAAFREQALDFARWTCAPFLEDRDFHFDAAHWAWGIDHARKALRSRVVEFLPLLGQIARASYGGIALLTRLGCRFNAHRLQKRVFAEYGIGSPSA